MVVSLLRGWFVVSFSNCCLGMLAAFEFRVFDRWIIELVQLKGFVWCL